MSKSALGQKNDKVEGAAKKWTNAFLYNVFNTYVYAFLCLYTQSRHFDNSKMINWVNLVQKLTKIQGKL